MYWSAAANDAINYLSGCRIWQQKQFTDHECQTLWEMKTKDAISGMERTFWTGKPSMSTHRIGGLRPDHQIDF
jgi:hypothetical protein